MTTPLQRGAVRCEPYSDGPWFFAYDPAHVDILNELKAYAALLGHASGGDAERRLQQVADAGLAIACELGHDLVRVDVLIGKKLGAAAKEKAEWVDPQRGFLRIASGRLRIDSLNTVAFGPNEPDEQGCELHVPSGDYDVIVHRVAFELMDDSGGARSVELPAAVLELHPVGGKGPKTKAASLALAAARGEVGAWLIGGRVDDGVFHGTTRAHDRDRSTVYLNLRGVHAEQLGLRFGHTLELQAGNIRVSAPFTGCLTRKGMQVYFGPEWYESNLGAIDVISGFSPFQASTPWLVDVVGSELPAGAPVTATVGGKWCAAPRADRAEVEIEHGKVTGRVASVSPATVILNFGPDAVVEAGLGESDVVELVFGGHTRVAHLHTAPPAIAELRRAVLTSGTTREDYVRSGALLVNSMTSWDDPEARLFWLMPLVGNPYWDNPHGFHPAHAPRPGERHYLDVAVGSEVVLRALRAESAT